MYLLARAAENNPQETSPRKLLSEHRSRDQVTQPHVLRGGEFIQTAGKLMPQSRDLDWPIHCTLLSHICVYRLPCGLLASRQNPNAVPHIHCTHPPARQQVKSCDDEVLRITSHLGLLYPNSFSNTPFTLDKGSACIVRSLVILGGSLPEMFVHAPCSETVEATGVLSQGHQSVGE